MQRPGATIPNMKKNSKRIQKKERETHFHYFFNTGIQNVFIKM